MKLLVWIEKVIERLLGKTKNPMDTLVDGIKLIYLHKLEAVKLLIIWLLKIIN